MLYILLIELIITLPMVQKICNKSIGNPLYIVWLSCILSVLCSIYQSSVNELVISPKCLLYVNIGMASILMGAIVEKNIHGSISAKDTIPTRIQVDVWKKVLFLFFFTVMTVLVIRSIKNITGVVSNILSDYSGVFRVITNSGEDNLPFILRQFFRVERIACYYFVMALISQIVNKQWNKSNFILVICIVLFVIQKAFMGSRSDLLYLMFTGVVVFLIEFQFQRGRLRIPTRYITRALIISFGILILFGLTRELFGRSRNSSIVDYLTFYIGGSIFSLDYRLKNILEVNRLFGYTLAGITRSLSMYLHIGELPPRLPSTYINGVYNGNTYTAFYKYYADWGVFGIAFFSFVFIYIMCSLYNKIFTLKEIKKRRRVECLYALFAEALFLVLYSDHFFSTRLNFGLIVDALAVILIDFLINNFKLKKKKI